MSVLDVCDENIRFGNTKTQGRKKLLVAEFFSSQTRTTKLKLKILSEKINLKWKLLLIRKYKSQDLRKKQKSNKSEKVSTTAKRKKNR